MKKIFWGIIFFFQTIFYTIIIRFSSARIQYMGLQISNHAQYRHRTPPPPSDKKRRLLLICKRRRSVCVVKSERKRCSRTDPPSSESRFSGRSRSPYFTGIPCFGSLFGNGPSILHGMPSFSSSSRKSSMYLSVFMTCINPT